MYTIDRVFNTVLSYVCSVKRSVLPTVLPTFCERQHLAEEEGEGAQAGRPTGRQNGWCRAVAGVHKVSNLAQIAPLAEVRGHAPVQQQQLMARGSDAVHVRFQ